MKTKEELNALKAEVENLNKKLAELSEDELTQIAGGTGSHQCPCASFCANNSKEECTYFNKVDSSVRCKYD